jgi:hypothetical protein
MQGLILVPEDHVISYFPNIPENNDNHGIPNFVVLLRFPDITNMNAGGLSDSKRWNLLPKHLNS